VKKLEKDVVDMKTGQKVKATQARKEAQPLRSRSARSEEPHAAGPVDEMKHHSHQAHVHMEEARNLLDPSTLGAYRGPRSPFSEGYKPLAGHEDRFQAHKERYEHHSDMADAAHEKVSEMERGAAQQAPDAPKARTTPSQQLWGKNKTPDGSAAKIRAALDRQAEAKPDLGKSDEKPDTSHEEAMHIARTDDPGSYAHYRLAKDPNISPEVAMHLAKVNEPGSVIHSALAASPNIIYEVASHLAKVNSPGSDVHHLLGKNPNTMLGKSDEKGVHQDTEHKGKSLAGLKTDASNSRKATNQKGDKAIAAAWNSKAKDDHKKVLSEMKAMPKPDLGKSDYHKRDEGVNKQASGPDKKGVSEAGVYVRGGDKQRAKIEHEKTRAEQKYMDKPDLGKSDDTSKIAKPDHITDSTWKNSGQQGRHPDHADNPHHDTLTRHGYKYSHSTPITRQDGTKYTHHTYKKGNHNVGIDRASGSWKWNASRTGSGRTYRGRDDKQLDKYLKGHGARNKTPNLGKSLEKSLTTPAHSAHGKLAAMLSKLRGTSLDKSEDDQDPASAHLAEIVQTLDDCLRTCTDEQAQEKISLAKDYLSALMAHLQYEPEMHSALTDLMHNGPESKGV